MQTSNWHYLNLVFSVFQFDKKLSTIAKYSKSKKQPITKKHCNRWQNPANCEKFIISLLKN